MMRHGLRTILISGVAILSAAGAWPLEAHVSVSGNDAAAGSARNPFATIERARDAIRGARKDGDAATTHSIVLHEGRYAIGKSVAFGREDSGTAAGPLLVRAAAGERVVLFGGQELAPDWIEPLRDLSVRERIVDKTARDRVLTVALKAHGIAACQKLKRRGFVVGSPWPPSQLYVGGRHMRMARWPNDGEVQMASVLDPGTKHGDKSAPPRGPTFTVDSDKLAHWADAKDFWINGILSRDWVWTFNKVACVDPTSRSVTLAYPELTLPKRESWIHDRFFFENLLEELDEAGEYYIDRDAGVLYFIPPEGFERGKTAVYLSMLTEPLVVVQGASHIVLRHLTMEGGRNEAVRIDNCESVRIEHCEIRNFGGDALHIKGRRCGVASTDIYRIGRRGVRLDGGDLDTLEPGESYVENCRIRDFSRIQRVYSPAVCLWGVGQRLSRSLISDGPHVAVNLRGNDHLVEYSEIHHVVRDFDDMGAVYANLGERPKQRGHVVRGNYFHHIGHESGRKRVGVYADNSSMGWLVEKNLFHRIGWEGDDTSWSVMANGAAHIVVRNNIFVDCRAPMEVSFNLEAWNKKRVPDYMRKWREAVTSPGFADSVHAKRYPELLRLLEEDRTMPDTNVFEKNLVYNQTVPLAHDVPWNVRFGPATRLQKRDNWVAEENPGFADLARGDFRLSDVHAVRRRIPGFEGDVARGAGLCGPVGPAR